MGCEALCDFTDNFVCSAHPAVKAVERDVLGCDYGGTSWTTSDQAEQIMASLALDARSRLLEVGTALPFLAASFDRLSHSDVLCCLPEKLDMLRECRRVATEDARMHFSVIEPAPGLSPEDHEQTVEAGPPFVDVPEGYEKLLRASGWQLLDRVDVTAEYADSLERLATGLRQNTAELQEAFGAEELRAAWSRRENAMNFARAGKLLRFVYVVAA